MKRIELFRFDFDGDQHFALVVDDGAPAPLTTAEWEVARLAARGMSNLEIARDRATSPRTIANQLASAFRKLGVQSRSELAARVG
jgi:DNA-binding NarL/FixJ family response regulator